VNLGGLLYLKWYSIFFYAGYLINYIKKLRIIRILNKLSYLAIIVFPLCGYLLSWMIPYQDLDYGYLGTASITSALINRQFMLMLIMILMAFLGTIFIYSISLIISKVKYVSSGLVYFGTASMWIYLIHIMFVGVGNNYVAGTIVSLAISLLVYWIYRVTMKILLKQT
jgi:hypothetical protein